jgi:hypothetical protein
VWNKGSLQPEALTKMFPGGVAPRAALIELGMSHASISRRCRPGGPWSRPIPGVIVFNNGTPTRSQLCRAALAHAGPQAMVTGHQAIRLHGGLRMAKNDIVHVLIPHASGVSSWGFATVERTIHLPEPVIINGIPVAPLARALIDAARRMHELDATIAMIADAVQRGLCDPRELQHEINEGSTIGSALPQRVVNEMNEGIHSVAEAWGRKVVDRSKLPNAEWNVAIYDTEGRLLGVTDCWWDDVGMALEIDSLQFHLGPAAYTDTVEKHTRFTAAGITIMHVLPSHLRDRPLAIVQQLRAAHQHASRRPRPDVVTKLWRPAA